MTIARMSIEGQGIGALPVSTVADSVKNGELVQLALPTPLPAMYYEAIWRTASYPYFSRSVSQIAQQCATRYAHDHADDTALPKVKAWADTENKN